MHWLWSVIIWVAVGALGGWLASIIMGKNAKMNMVANIVVGLIGSGIGMLIFGLILGFGSPNIIGKILVSLLGSCLFLFLIDLYKKKKR